MQLYLFNKKIESFFQLLGTKEDDISYSIGYAFANCDQFIKNFLIDLGLTEPFNFDKIKIKLQTHEKDKGFTDFEIIQDGRFHLIIEAKRGWQFPSTNQLTKYSQRTSFLNSQQLEQRIIVFNESNDSFTKSNFLLHKVDNVSITVISWRKIISLANNSILIGKNTQNKILKDLIIYLKAISTMQNKDSNSVYVVSLGKSKPSGWGISWRDIVNKRNSYFHPIGGGRGGWPAEPPNYIAFRYDGILQSIHHIDSYEVFDNPSLHYSSAPNEKWAQHYLYHLGPAIKPAKTMKSGKRIIRSMRVWADLDLLLTCETIEEARDKSKIR